MKKISFLILVIAVLFSCKNEQKKFAQNAVINEDKLENSFYVNSVNPFEENFNQYFYFENTGKQKIIVGKQGTKIIFPKECFTTIPKKIKVELKEFYSIPDMIKGNLSTQTKDGHILITGGMIYFNVYDENGDTLKLNKDITINMPTKKIDKDMKLFKGDDSGGVIKWELTNQDLTFIDNSERNIVYDAPVDVLPPGVKNIDTVGTKPSITVTREINQQVTGLYSFSTRTTGYYNIDKYYLKEFEDKEKYRKMSVIDKTDRDDKFYRLIYRDIDAIDPLTFLKFHTKIDYDKEKVKVENIENINLKILKDQNAYLLIINKKQNLNEMNYYYSLTSINTKDTVHEIKNLNKTTKEELDNFLEEKLGSNLWTRSK